MINEMAMLLIGAPRQRELIQRQSRSASRQGPYLPVGFMACLLVVTLAGCGRSGTPRVDLRLEPESVTIGTDDADAVDLSRDLEVRVTNNSGRSYRIVDVASSCACTLAGPLSATTLAPGEHCTAQFRVTVPRVGKTVTWAEFVTIPAAVPPLRMRFELIGEDDLLPRIVLSPSGIPLIGEIAGEAAETSATVTTLEQSGAEHWLSGAEADSSDIQVRLQPASADEELPNGIVRRTYTMDVIGCVPADRFGQRVQIHLIAGGSRRDRIIANPPIWVGPERRSPCIALPAVLTVNRNEFAASGGQTKRVQLFGPADGGSGDWNVKAPDWVSVKIQPPEQMRGGLVAVAVIEPAGRIPSDVTDVEIIAGQGGDHDGPSEWRIVLHVRDE